MAKCQHHQIENQQQQKLKLNNLRNLTIIMTPTMQATPIKAPITTPMNTTARNKPKSG